VQFAGGSKAMNVSADRFGGPERCGPVPFACEWPASDVRLTRAELDAALVLDAASRAEIAFGDDHLPEWSSDEDGPRVDLIR